MSRSELETRGRWLSCRTYIECHTTRPRRTCMLWNGCQEGSPAVIFCELEESLDRIAPAVASVAQEQEYTQKKETQEQR